MDIKALKAAMERHAEQLSAQANSEELDKLREELARCQGDVSSMKSVVDAVGRAATEAAAAAAKANEGLTGLQKEMAERLSAVPGSKAWGRLSVMTQVTLDVQYLFDVPPESFRPPPKVDSSIIRLTPKKDLTLPVARKSLDQVLRWLLRVVVNVCLMR